MSAELGLVAPARPVGRGVGLPSSGGAQQSTQATRHPEYLFQLRVTLRSGCWASPLRRSFPSATSFHLSRTRCGPSIHRPHPGGAAHHWVVGAAKHFAFRDAGRRAVLLVPIVARLPCVEVSDLEVNSQGFVIHLTLLCENLFWHAHNQSRARDRPTTTMRGQRNSSSRGTFALLISAYAAPSACPFGVIGGAASRVPNGCQLVVWR